MRKFLLSIAVVLSLTVIFAVACAGGNGAVAPGQEFQLNIGQQTSLSGEDLVVKFKSVSEDSRCPTGVM
jgi:hypothetical protein